MQDRLTPVNVLPAHFFRMNFGQRCYENSSDKAMGSRSRPNRINIDLQGYKQSWIDYCSARNITPSEAFRLVVAKLADKGYADVLRNVAEGEPDGGKIRKEIRLTESETVQAESLAFKEGFSLSRWIVALVRARLTGTVQLGQQEMELLARSNMQLLTLGRNLNQIAKALNTSPENRRVFKVNVIEDLQTRIKEHTTVVASVMAANVERWRIR